MEPHTLIILLLVFNITSTTVSFTTDKPIKEFIYRNIILKISPNKQIKELINLNKQLKDINNERNQLSAQDNYAKWTKLNREYTKLETCKKELEISLNSHKSSIDSYLKYLILLSTSIPLQLISLFYSRKQILVVPKHTFPFYIEYLINFPFLPRGTIGILFLSFAIKTTINWFFNFVKFFFFTERLPKPVQLVNNNSKQTLQSITE